MTMIKTPPRDTPDATTQDAVTPDGSAPKVSAPDVTTPEVTTPEVLTPEVTTPEVITGVAADAAVTGPAIDEHTGASPATQHGETRVTEIIVVTSGKGGVGKTTTSASLACGLAKAGKKTAVIDFDVGLRNLDLIMGCERRVVYDFVNVVLGEASIKQALIKDKRFDNLYVLAASQTRDKDALTKEGVEKVLKAIADEGFEYIVCDSPAGIEKGAFLAMYFADRAVVVVNPEVSSVRDSDRILGLLASKTKKAENGERVKESLLLTRYSPARVEKGDMLSIGDVEEILGLKVIGVIPESPEVLQSSNAGVPVILDDVSQAGQAYMDAVSRILGNDVPLRFTTVERKGFFAKMFGN
jgi:septum site-determining protein MinD